MSHQQHPRRHRRRSEPFYRLRQHQPVRVIRQQLPRRICRQPPNLIHLIIRYKLPTNNLSNPVIHHLRPRPLTPRHCIGQWVRHMAHQLPQPHHKTRLLTNLPHRRHRQRFPRIHLPLRQRPIVIPRPVHTRKHSTPTISRSIIDAHTCIGTRGPPPQHRPRRQHRAGKPRPRIRRHHLKPTNHALRKTPTSHNNHPSLLRGTQQRTTPHRKTPTTKTPTRPHTKPTTPTPKHH